MYMDDNDDVFPYLRAVGRTPSEGFKQLVELNKEGLCVRRHGSR